MEKVKCKDFTVKSHNAGSKLYGQENLIQYDVYYIGKLVHTCYKSADARKWVSKAAKFLNDSYARR